MAVLPTFDPQGRATDASQVANTTRDSMSSMMERAAESRRQDQQLAMQKEQWDFQKPIMQAKANADMQEFGAKMYAVKQTQDLRAQFNASVPQIMAEIAQVDRSAYVPPNQQTPTTEGPAGADEFRTPLPNTPGSKVAPQQNTMGDTDWAGQAQRYDTLAAKLSPFAGLREGKALIDTLQAQGLQAHARFLASAQQKFLTTQKGLELDSLEQRKLWDIQASANLDKQNNDAKILIEQSRTNTIAQMHVQAALESDPQVRLQKAKSLDTQASQLEATGGDPEAVKLLRESAQAWRIMTKVEPAPTVSDAQLNALITKGSTGTSPAPVPVPTPAKKNPDVVPTIDLGKKLF